MTASCDVVVVGAGIVGAACAYFLGKEGLRVVVVERGIVGGGATAAGMGHLVAMDDSPAQLALTKLSLAMWSELRTELPVGVEFQQTGTLWVAADEDEMKEVLRKEAVYRSAGLACEVLDGDALAEAEPQLRRGLAGALRVMGRCGDLSAGCCAVSASGCCGSGCAAFGLSGGVGGWEWGFAGGRAKSFGGVCGECCGMLGS